MSTAGRLPGSIIVTIWGRLREGASDCVEQEVETAFEKERKTGEIVLFPTRIDDAIDNIESGWAAHIRRTRHVGNFENWGDDSAFQESLKLVLTNLRVEP